MTRNPPLELTKADRQFLSQPPCFNCGGPGEQIPNRKHAVCGECLGVIAVLKITEEG